MAAVYRLVIAGAGTFLANALPTDRERARHRYHRRNHTTGCAIGGGDTRRGTCDARKQREPSVAAARDGVTSPSPPRTSPVAAAHTHSQPTVSEPASGTTAGSTPRGELSLAVTSGVARVTHAGNGSHRWRRQERRDVTLTAAHPLRWRRCKRTPNRP